MKEALQTTPLVDNKEKSRFELGLNGFTAFIEYRKNGNKVIMIHTEVPPELEGRGVGGALVEKALAYVEERDETVLPLCPFIAAYIRRHPEWSRVLELPPKQY